MSNVELMGTLTVRTKDGSIREITEKFEHNDARAKEWCENAIRSGYSTGNAEGMIFYPPASIIEAEYGPIKAAPTPAPAPAKTGKGKPKSNSQNNRRKRK